MIAQAESLRHGTLESVRYSAAAAATATSSPSAAAIAATACPASAAAAAGGSAGLGLKFLFQVAEGSVDQDRGAEEGDGHG